MLCLRFVEHVGFKNDLKLWGMLLSNWKKQIQSSRKHFICVYLFIYEAKCKSRRQAFVDEDDSHDAPTCSSWVVLLCDSFKSLPLSAGWEPTSQPRPNFPSWYFPKVRVGRGRGEAAAAAVFGAFFNLRCVCHRNLHQQHVGHDVQEGKLWNRGGDLPGDNQGKSSGWDAADTRERRELSSGLP